MAEAPVRDVMNYRVPRPVKRIVEAYARTAGISMAAAATVLMLDALEAKGWDTSSARSEIE